MIKQLQSDVIRNGDDLIVYLRTENDVNIEAHLCNGSGLIEIVQKLRKKIQSI